MESTSENVLRRSTRRAADFRLRRRGIFGCTGRMLKVRLPGLMQGSLVTVVDGRGIALGSALYSDASQIAARMISRTAGMTRTQYLAELRVRVDAALARRRVLAPVTESDNAHRLIFSEADALPGIVADRYNDLVLLQLLTQGTAQDDVRAVVVEALREEFAGAELTIWERPDARIRELEQLRGACGRTVVYELARRRSTTEFRLNGLRFEYECWRRPEDRGVPGSAAELAGAAAARTGLGLPGRDWQGA